ncbi:hypothetical protein RhiirA4_503246 [Rhizophagus irregularis]|uniref:BED-type domain-containing protein n=2 Tax=Rhizophagus irregularis TaxID=588596 RepID=A0A2I1H860_9GLOM|nr:hypothetical protein RhiirA4_503246 [Rhizophagus irregularis]
MVNNKSKPGRKQNGVWTYFKQTPLKSAGHYSGECKFCHKKWQRAYIGILQSHLANECTDCPEEIQNYWLGFIAAKDSLDDDDSASIASSTGSNKKRKVASNGQTEIDDFFENRELPESKAAAIDRALIRAFVCCGIPFAVIDSPFFRELLYQLRPNYTPPTRKVLSESLLNQETSRVNKAINKELEHSQNLTLGNYFLSSRS